MRTAVRAAILVVIVVIAVIAVVFWTVDRFAEGANAYERGDYARAVSLMRPLAELGLPAAQYFIGVLYDEGMGGVPQDTASSVVLVSQGRRARLFVGAI